MALYPKRIVLKNSTDSVRDVRSQVETGLQNQDEIVAGELVLQRGDGQAQLIALDANNNTVVVGGDDLYGIEPTLLLNFDEGPSDTPHTLTGNEIWSWQTPGKFGPRTYWAVPQFPDDAPCPNTILIDSADDDPVGVSPWTFQFWIKVDPSGVSPADVDYALPPIGTEFGFNYGLIASRRDYPFGPGAFNIYLDAGTPDLGGLGTATSKTSGVAYGAVVFGISLPPLPSAPNMSVAHGSADPLIPAEGNVVDSGSVGVIDNQWHHVAVSHEGDGTYVIYIDGVRAGSNKISGPINHDDAGLSGIIQPSGWSLGGSLADNNLIQIQAPPGEGNTDGFLYAEFASANAYIDALSFHVGVAAYRGLTDFEVPTAQPDLTRLKEPPVTLRRLPDTLISKDTADGSYLAYDLSKDAWKTVPAPQFDISGTTLDGLGDVNLDDAATIQDKEALVWDSTAQEWTNQSILLRTLVDFTFDGQGVHPQGQNFVQFNEVTNKFESGPIDWSANVNPAFLGAGINLSSPGDKFVLMHDAFANETRYQSLEGKIELGELDGVTIRPDIASTGDVWFGLAYNSTAEDSGWRATEFGSDILYQQISNGNGGVAPTEGDFLTFRDGVWKNETVQGLQADLTQNVITQLRDVTEASVVREITEDDEEWDDTLPAEEPQFFEERKALQFTDHQEIRVGYKEETPHWGASLVHIGSDSAVGDQGLWMFPQADYPVQESDFDTAGSYFQLYRYKTELKALTFEFISRSGEFNFRVQKNGSYEEQDTYYPELRLYSNVAGSVDERRHTIHVPRDNSSTDFFLPKAPTSYSAYAFNGWALRRTTDSSSGDSRYTEWAYLGDGSMGGLVDVDLESAAPTSGQTLIWDSTIDKFRPGLAAADLGENILPNIGDVEGYSSISDGQVLVWNHNRGKWQNKDLSIADNTLGELFDVTLTGDGAPVDGNGLVYDGATGIWKAGPVGADLGLSVLGDLSDVNMTEPPVTGQVLIYNGFEWLPGDQTGGGGGGGGGGTGFSIPVSDSATTGQGQAGSMLVLEDMQEFGFLTKVTNTSSENLWVTLYATEAAQVADKDRAYGGGLATGLQGVIADLTIPANQQVLPGINYFNAEDPLDEAIYVSVRTTTAYGSGLVVNFAGFGMAAATAIFGGTFGSG